MTLKQFVYLGTGLGISYLIFVFFFSTNPFLSLPAIAFFALLGATFAFVPVSDRPLDHWLAAFFRAVYSPTQGFWKIAQQKDKIDPQEPIFKNRLEFYLASLGVPTFPLPQPKPVLTRIPFAPPPPLPKKETPNEVSRLNEKVKNLQTKLAEAQNQILKLQTIVKTEEITPLPQLPSVQKSQARVVEPQKIKKPLPVLTSFPNVINGVVLSQSGTPLERAIVIIHNKDGLPVRALKTNKLGQFAGATPLPSGVYTLTIEKEGLQFDTLQITLKGTVLASLPIFPKKGEVSD
jgi:hypothetical protein